MSNFKPISQPKKANLEIPYYEDAKKKDGWEGQSSGKSISSLKADISELISKLGGNVTKFEEGEYVVGSKTRGGYRINYAIENDKGEWLSGRMDVAALPVRSQRYKERSMVMLLFMVREALQGMWFMQQFSPGYSALLPFMLVDENNTFSDMWIQKNNISYLLPSPGEEFMDGEIVS